MRFDSDLPVHAEGRCERVGAAQPIGAARGRQPDVDALVPGHLDGAAPDRARRRRSRRRRIAAPRNCGRRRPLLTRCSTTGRPAAKRDRARAEIEIGEPDLDHAAGRAASWAETAGGCRKAARRKSGTHESQLLVDPPRRRHSSNMDGCETLGGALADRLFDQRLVGDRGDDGEAARRRGGRRAGRTRPRPRPRSRRGRAAARRAARRGSRPSGRAWRRGGGARARRRRRP